MRRHVLLAAAALAALYATDAPADTPNRRPTEEERGEELYARHCVQCHGATAAGDGPAARALVHPVPDLRGRQIVDDAAVDVVFLGRGAMPSFEESFDRADARRVLLHMQRLAASDAPGPDARAEPPPAVEESPSPDAR